MKGWKLASSPLMTPMPRGAACRYSGRPFATAASTRACIAFHCSPPGSRCIQVIDSGRPLARASASTRSNSASKRSGPNAAGRSRSPSAPRRGPGPGRRCPGPPVRPPRLRRPGSRGPREVRWLSVRPVEKPAAPACSASRSRPAWRRCRRRGGLLRQRALAHHRHAQRVVRHQRPGSPGCAAWRPARPCSRQSSRQLKRTPSASATPGMSSTPSISAISSASRPGTGREADAAVAHQHRGHAVVDAGAEGLVPAGLAVVVGVDVDEARREPGAVAGDALARRAGDAADLGDAAVLHADVGGEGRAPVPSTTVAPSMTQSSILASPQMASDMPD
jgi:hypothetical protein